MQIFFLLLLFIFIAKIPRVPSFIRKIIFLILFEIVFFSYIQWLPFLLPKYLTYYYVVNPLYLIIYSCNILLIAKVSDLQLTRRKIVFLILFEGIITSIDIFIIISDLSETGSSIISEWIHNINLFLILLMLFRFIYKHYSVKTNKSSSGINSNNLQQFGESELISFIDKIKEGDFPKASISKSSIDGDYVIVRDLKGVVLSQIKISEISRY